MAVAEMWGTCDGIGITFREVNGRWVCEVPADLDDGMYVLELWARSYTDVIVYHTAIMYLCDSKCTYFEILDDDILVTIYDDIQVKVVVDCEHKIYQGREEIYTCIDNEQKERTDNNYTCHICINEKR